VLAVHNRAAEIDRAWFLVGAQGLVLRKRSIVQVQADNLHR
jgi:hypothetical protein